MQLYICILSNDVVRDRSKKEEEEKPIFGLPSSCGDLNKMGHTLNAIYMIKGSNGSKITAVFCNFQTSESRQHSLSPYSTCKFLKKIF